MASADEDLEMRNLEWKFTFGKPVGHCAQDYMDPNELRKMRIEEKTARLKTLKILCSMKGKSVCGMRDDEVIKH